MKIVIIIIIIIIIITIIINYFFYTYVSGCSNMKVQNTFHH